LAATRRDSGAPLYDALRDLRTGVAIGELRQVRIDLPTGQAASLGDVLNGVSRHYRGLDPDAPAPADGALLHDIDAAIGDLAGHSDATIQREGVLGLVSLRRNLFPDAPGYERIAA
jgi:hypothetical protein